MVTLLRTASLLSLVGAVTLALGCDAAVWGNGNAATETRDLSGFSAIEISAQIDVELEVIGDDDDGPPERTPTRAPVATLRCDENLLGRIETFVDDGTLHVHTDGDVDLRPRAGCTLTVATPRLVAIGIEGPGALRVHGMPAQLERIDLEGPAELDVEDIAAGALAVRVEGPAELVLAGVADVLAIDLEGPVELDAANLDARTVELVASGPVEASVRADERCVLDVEGPAEIDVYGDPRSRVVDAEGPTEIHFR